MHPYLSAFMAILARRPLTAMQIAWWWVARRRVRALVQLRVAAAALPTIYPLWLALHQPAQGILQPHEREDRADLAMLAVHLHLGPRQSPDAAVASVIAQSFGDWRLYVTSPGGDRSVLPADDRIVAMPAPTRSAGLATMLEATGASHVVPLAADCSLTPGALLAYVRAIAAASPRRDGVIYADQDEKGRLGARDDPWLKPEWDADLFLAQDYISAACALPVIAARQAGADGGWPDEIAIYALLARLFCGPHAQTPQHLPYVAVTTPARAWSRAYPARREVVRRAVGMAVGEGPFGTLVIRRPVPDPAPRVCVIVPTRDRLDLLETCVAGVLDRTDYPNLELVIADNDSVEPGTLAYLDGIARNPRVKVVRWPYSYNYAAINNFAVTQTDSGYLCLLNNDTEVIGADWLGRMMAHAVRPGVGAVGARLLYADRSIQHAGVVVGMGEAAGHAHRGLAEGEPGYFAHALVTREATAVTAACLVVARDAFLAVGGLDEVELAIAYNDVDLCLKLRAAGLRNIYAAEAALIHHESKSRGLDFAPEHLARYGRELQVLQDRWGTIGYRDPTHHAALDPASEVYRLML